ncbi:hypothetical protein [Streptococcus canis]|nr:hypothetical protein [Streptococcus canis]
MKSLEGDSDSWYWTDITLGKGLNCSDFGRQLWTATLDGMCS